jgi:adenine-specific DNA-methyltransferase
MEYKPLRPRDALNKAFLKVKPSRPDMERFKAGLSTLLDHVNPAESEEFHKNLLTDFLRKTGYDPQYFINTKGRNDLVIHNGDSAKSPVGVIIEAKNPSNQNEMLRLNRINVKAMQELLLYYLRERITNNNLELRYLVATNVYEWFIFDAQVFEQCFAKDKELVRVFRGFDDRRLAGTNTDFFYKKVAPHYINAALSGIQFTYVNLRDYEKELRDGDKANDAKLIPLFKVLSPEHLLKLPFTNDSNTLDKQFYTELLHIIGLTERKEGGKKLIERKPEGERNVGSLLENAIGQLDSLDKISRMEKPSQFGTDAKERLFNVALELAITWTNRVLFLKLLEAQLISYHKGDRNYAFLNLEKVGSYDDLNGLFFEVLARTPGERSAEMKKRFGKVPYLNSSLFEPSAIEHAGLFISQIKDRKLPVHPATVLKDKNGKKRTGELDALEYFFAFLDAYDFTADGAEEIQEDNKTLINASVLGLIFEKINGYKDGSFFTPGFITMYMCRETIRRAVIQKFNQEKDWNCETVEQLTDRIDDNADANRIINSLKICDPAVGSGHFLVSALNELIALKSELGVLCDRDGKRLKNYHVEVVNDELFVTDEDGEFFEYKPKLPESQRVQEMLFHEKQTIIENCLFGVDINPNSVKICRLRLWIELLKNAYYKAEDELETLPNIDINIKCGNSLISRFPLDSDLKKALKNSKWNISSYKLAVMSYRNAESKEQKRAMEKLIGDIKGNFEAEIYSDDPRVVKLRKERGKLFELTNQTQMFELSKAEKAAWNKKVKEHTAVIEKLEAEIEAIKSNKIYENAFEWRFEFPEVLDDDGSFVGFDAVIGNPPYIRQEEFAEIKPYLKQSYRTFTGTADLYVYFVELGLRNLRTGGTFSFITPNKWMRATYGQPLRNFIKENRINSILDFGDLPVFEEATTYPCILSIDKSAPQSAFKAANITTLNYPAGLPAHLEENQMEVRCEELREEGWQLENQHVFALMQKLRAAGTPLGEYVDGKFYRGILTGFNEAFVIDRETRDRLIAEDPKSNEIIKPFLRGRDVKRWSVNFDGQYLIKIESSENKKHPWSGLEDKEAEKVFAKTYPAVYGFMRQYREQLVQRCDQGKYFWELRACVYWHEFEQPKIIYPDIYEHQSFVFDNSGFFSVNTTYFIPNAKMWMVALLNATVTEWFYGQISNRIRGGYLRAFSESMKQIPIPAATLAQQSEIEKRVEKILAQKKETPDADVSALETEIDQLVYKLYGLTDEEVKIVEGLGGA